MILISAFHLLNLTNHYGTEFIYFFVGKYFVSLKREIISSILIRITSSKSYREISCHNAFIFILFQPAISNISLTIVNNLFWLLFLLFFFNLECMTFIFNSYDEYNILRTTRMQEKETKER